MLVDCFFGPIDNLKVGKVWAYSPENKDLNDKKIETEKILLEFTPRQLHVNQRFSK